VSDERGFLPHEIEIGEDQAWHIPPCGCLAFILFVAAAGYGLWRLAGL